MVAYHPFDEKIWDDPFETYRALRDEAPVYYLEDLDCWFISRFEDVWALQSDQSNFISTRGTTTTHLLTHQTPQAPNLTYYDGQEHNQVRSYFNSYFLPKHIFGPAGLAASRATLDDTLGLFEGDWNFHNFSQARPLLPTPIISNWVLNPVEHPYHV